MSHRLALAASLVACVATTHAVFGQVQTGTGAISGVVTDAATRQPLAGAVVMLELDRSNAPPAMLRPGPISQQITDDKGRFVFTSLRPAQYFVNASMLGYFDGGHGRAISTREGTRIVLADRQWFNRADIQLSRPGGITGRVIDEHGEPVVGVPVRVLRQVMVAGRPQVASSTNTQTDDRGVYRIGGLAPGRYYVSVPSVQMAAPADALSAVVSSGTSFGRSSTTSDPTLDIAGQRLVVGRFAVPSLGPDGRVMAYPPLFHPAATSLTDASVVELDYGSDKAGIDFTLRPLPVAAISGVIVGPDEARSSLTLRLLPAGSEELGLGAEAATALVGANGRFTFVNVPAGDYVIEARASIVEYEFEAGSARYNLPTPPGARSTGGSAMSVRSGTPGTGLTTMRFGDGRWWGRASVAVSGRDVTGLTIPLREAVRMTGHYVLDGTTPPPSTTMAAFIVADPASGRASLGQPRNSISPREESATFVIDGLLPGEYVLRFGASGGWIIKSIIWDGRDYTYTPFDASRGRDFTGVMVTLTDKAPRLEGTVVGADSRPAAAGAVIAFPVERDQWSNYGLTPLRIAAARLSNAGTFSLATLPAGEYYVVAVDAGQINAWQDPAFLETAAATASRVPLSWGQTVTTNLKMN